MRSNAVHTESNIKMLYCGNTWMMETESVSHSMIIKSGNLSTTFHLA